MVRNLDVFNFALTGPDVTAIEALDQDKYLMESPMDPQLVRHIQSSVNYTD